MDSTDARRGSAATEQLHVATDAAISRIRSAIRSRNSPRQLKNDSETIEEIDKILKELDATLQTNLGGDLDLSEDNETRVVKLQTPDEGQVWQPGLHPSPPITVRRTHPATYKPHDHHIDAIETFEKDLLKAKICNDAKPVRYTKVEVLLVTWKENDDIAEEVHEEVKALEKLFRKLNFTVRPYAIPNVNCQNELLYEVLSFLRPHQNDPSGETLLIVYYNGHGSIQDRETSYWHPTAWAAILSDDGDSSYNGPAVEWNAIQELFGPDTTPDTLFILDCCYAGAAIKRQPTGHAMELLAACGSGDRTEAGDDSFTMRIVKCMKEMRKTQGSFQVAWLYESLINASQTPTPIHIKLNRSLYSITLPKLDMPDTNNPSVKPIATNELLFPPPPQSARRSSSPGSIHAPEGSIFSDDNYVLDGMTTASSVISESITVEDWQYKVLLTVKLRSNVVPRATNWCLSFPSNEVEGLEGVRVESLYPTKSTLLLVTMPVRLWVHLREDPAYTFIDFVKTSNILVPEPSQTELLAPISSYPSVETKGANDNDSNEIASRLATMQNFFEKTKNQHLRTKQKSPGAIAHKCKQIAHKLHLPSQLKSEQDPTFDLVQHVVEQMNILRNGKGEYTGVNNYNSYFNLQIKQRFKTSKNSMKEALHQSNIKGDINLENTIMTQIDELETDVVDMTRLEVEKMTVKNYFDRSLSTSPASTFDLVKSKKRKSGTKVVKPQQPQQQQHDCSIPDDQEMKPTPSNNSGIPRTDSIPSIHPSPRIDSGRWLRGESGTSGKRKSRIFGK